MPLTGPEKAVLMLLSLDESTAGPIVAELDDADLRKLREVAALMRAVPANALDNVYGEFVDRAREAVAVPRGGISYLKRLATRALGEHRSQDIFSDQPPQTSIERISQGDPTAVAGVLEREHPQIVAAILSQLDSSRAGLILEALPEEHQTRVLARLATLTEVPAGLLEGVATAVAGELPPPGAEASMSVDGVGRAAALVKKLSKDASENVLRLLEGESTEVAEQIRGAMYTFEDLKMIDAKSFRALLKEVPQDRLVLALKTASEELKQKIFASMSARAGELLRDDLESLGGVRLADVEAAQREIVETALRLSGEGTITLGDSDDLV